MSIIAKDNSKSKYPPIAEGQYTAICYGVIDIGEQFMEKYQKYAHKVRIMWEIPEETIEIEGVKKPRAISKEYTLSLSEKSNLRADLIGWRGKSFTESELESFDLKNILGKACQMQIVHVVKGDNTYANISGIFAMPKGVKPPKTVNELVYLDWDDENFETELTKLPEWIIETVKKSITYVKRFGSAASSFVTMGDEIIDEDLPF